MAKIDSLKNKEGEIVYPRTVADAVYNRDGSNLEERIKPMEHALGFYDISDWGDVQAIIRAGKTNEYFAVGDQLVSGYDDGEIIWEIIGIDVEEPTDSNFTHSMTLQTKDVLNYMQFDGPESELRDEYGIYRGRNDYIISAIRQWLNSDEPTFNWQPQHSNDKEPTRSLDIYNGPGFLNRLDPELAAVLGETNKVVYGDHFSDKVFLLSRAEVGLRTSGGGTIYPYYKSGGSRIKKRGDNISNWWLRSPYFRVAGYVDYVNSSGQEKYTTAESTYGVAPAVVIV